MQLKKLSTYHRDPLAIATLLIPLILFSCKSADTKPANFIDLQFFIQPWKGTTVIINDKPVKFKLISIEKTLALVEARLPAESATKPVDLVLKNKNGVSIHQQARLLRKENLPPLFQITGNQYNIHGYFQTGEQPKSVTFIDNRRVCVPSLHPNNGIFIIDIIDGTTTELQLPDHFIKQGGFVESLIIESQKELWVSQMTTAMIHVFDLKSLKYKQSIQSGGKWTKVLEYDPKNNKVYASNWITNDISVIDPVQKKEIQRVSVKGVPRGLLISHDNALLYYTIYEQSDGGSGYYGALQLTDYSSIKLPSSSGAKRHIVADQHQYYISDMARNTIEIFDQKTHMLKKTIRVCQKPNTIELSPDHSRLFVSCRGPNGPDGYLNKGLEFGKLMVIDLKKNQILFEIEGGNQPTGLDVSPDGKYVVLSDFLDHRIRVYSTK